MTEQMKLQMEIEVRHAQPDDAEGLVAFFNPIIESGRYTAFDTPFTAAAEREFIQTLPERGIFLVAVRSVDQRIVGFQSMSPFSSPMQSFAHVGICATFVDLNCQRQGVAKRLFANTFKIAREKGYEKIFTYVRADNPGGLATYTSQGFRIVGTAQKQAKIRGKYVDEVIIERML